jgi:hypothetical protein
MAGERDPYDLTTGELVELAEMILGTHPKSTEWTERMRRQQEREARKAAAEARRVEALRNLGVGIVAGS